MPRGEIHNRKEYTEWIRRVREASGLGQSEFGKRIVRFGNGKNDRKVNYYERGAVVCWERGDHLPGNVETVISIALLNYSISHPEPDFETESGISPSLRNERFLYVDKCIRKFLGKKLYCKNLKEVLVLQAVRGLFSLCEVPDIYNEINAMLLKSNKRLTAAQIREYAQQRNTGTLYGNLLDVQDKQTFFRLLEEKKDFYAIGYRVLGERMKEEYERNYRKNTGLDFQRAVHFYAPVYRDSCQHLFAADIRVSRRWIIDLCVQLHFSRESVNRILLNAQFPELAEEPENPEAWICRREDCENGTVAWYEKMEEKYLHVMESVGSLEELRECGALETDFEPVCFWRVQRLTLRERMIYALALGCYVQKYGLLPLPVYLLDFMIARKDMSKALKKWSSAEYDQRWKKVLKQWETCGDGPCKDLCNLIKTASDDAVLSAVPGMPEYTLISEREDEYRRYYEVSDEKLAGLQQSRSGPGEGPFTGEKEKTAFYQEVNFAAVMYSLVTGFLYKGRTDSRECMVLKQAGCYDSGVGIFFRYMWKVYLGKNPVFRGRTAGYWTGEKNGSSPDLNLSKILHIICEIINEFPV